MMAKSRRYDWQRLEDDKAALHYRTGKPEEERVCLKCQQKFMSFGKMNRLCDNCKKMEDFRYSGWSDSYQVLPK
jgi:protein-arginine kinase activator protein McsA